MIRWTVVLFAALVLPLSGAWAPVSQPRSLHSRRSAALAERDDILRAKECVSALGAFQQILSLMELSFLVLRQHSNGQIAAFSSQGG